MTWFDFYLFIFGSAGPLLLRAALSVQGRLLLGTQGRGAGSVVGLMWAQVGSVVAVHRLSCCTACGIPVSRPAIEPLSPALEGGFLTTGPPG